MGCFGEIPMTSLPDDVAFDRYSMLILDEQGRFVRKSRNPEETDAVVPPDHLAGYLDEKVFLPNGVTDVFVWVHGWRTDLEAANRNARRLFHAINAVRGARASLYPRLGEFRPEFLAVHWPSMSAASLGGYKRMRDRARAMTDQGYAEFFLASLLGYLEGYKGGRSGGMPTTLRAARGFRVHCVGHSFGGRFLTAAIRAAATPESPKTLSLLREFRESRSQLLGASPANAGRFEFTVDSIVVFQMAAPHASFGSQLRALLDEAPLSGPIVLTHSPHDKANCRWHWYAEWFECGIGCRGASQPRESIHAIRLKPLDQPYAATDLPPRRVINVDASSAYTRSSLMEVSGAHSDFWYEESIHLLLSVAEAARHA
jgi:hypothetical protein